MGSGASFCLVGGDFPASLAENQPCRLVIFEASSCVRTVSSPYLATGKAKEILGCLVLTPYRVKSTLTV